MSIWAWGFILWLLVVVSFLGFLHLGRHRDERRLVDHAGARLKDVALHKAGPGDYVRFDTDDGFPGGPRGVVWTEKKRAAYRRKLQRMKMRIVAGG